MKPFGLILLILASTGCNWVSIYMKDAFWAALQKAEGK